MKMSRFLKVAYLLFFLLAFLFPARQSVLAQDYFSSQTDSQPVQGWRPTDRAPYKQEQQRANQNQDDNSRKVTGQGLERLHGRAEDGQYSQPSGGSVQQYPKPAMVTPQNRRDNPESVYYGKASQIPRNKRQLKTGVPIQGTNSLGARTTAQKLNSSANQTSPSGPGGHQSVFNVRILVPDPTFSGKKGLYHNISIIYPGHNPRLAGDNGSGPVNTDWAEVDVVDHTQGVVPISHIRACYSRSVGNRSMVETIYVDRAWTVEHPNGFKAGVSAQAAR